MARFYHKAAAPFVRYNETPFTRGIVVLFARGRVAPLTREPTQKQNFDLPTLAQYASSFLLTPLLSFPTMFCNCNPCSNALLQCPTLIRNFMPQFKCSLQCPTLIRSLIPQFNCPTPVPYFDSQLDSPVQMPYYSNTLLKSVLKSLL